MKIKLTMLSILLLAVMLTCQPLALARKAGAKPGNHALAELPDLVINKVTIVDKATGSFEVVVQNKGKGDASSCQLRLWIKDQKGENFAYKNTNQPALKSGQSITIKITVNKALGANLEYTITTDANEKVDEVADNNNAWQDHTAGQTTGQAQGMGNAEKGMGKAEKKEKISAVYRPDLIIKGVSVNTKEGKAIVTVVNKCKGKANNSHVTIFFYIGESQKKSGNFFTMGTFGVPALAPGEEKPVVISTHYIDDDVAIRVVVDYFNEIKEASESNNGWDPVNQPFPEKGGYCDPPYDD